VVDQVRFLSPRQVEALTSLSARHLARMADAGRFPKPARLGEGKNGRLGFVEAEVLAWNAARLEERNSGAKPVQAVESGTVGTTAAAPQTSPRPKSSGRRRERPAASARDAR
jgi:predicted DNA-binding transcriptional regulator AlpA